MNTQQDAINVAHTGLDRCQIIGYSSLADSTYADLSSGRSYTEDAQLSREYSSWISPSSAGWGLSGSPSIFSAVFMAEEIDGIWDKGPDDTKQLMYRHCWRPFWNVPETCLFHWWGFFSLVQYNYVFLLLRLCILIVMFCIFCFHRANWHSSAILNEVFPCFFLSCKANARV